MQQVCREEKLRNNWVRRVEGIWAFGPRGVGSNILVNEIPGLSEKLNIWTPASSSASASVSASPQLTDSVAEEEEGVSGSEDGEARDEGDVAATQSTSSEALSLSPAELLLKVGALERGIVNGFLNIASGGPLCGEPMTDVCFVIKKIEFMSSIDPSSTRYIDPSQETFLTLLRKCFSFIIFFFPFFSFLIFHNIIIILAH